jgi:hypothetical protein
MLFEEWALKAMKEMNGAEATEREAIEMRSLKRPVTKKAV